MCDTTYSPPCLVRSHLSSRLITHAPPTGQRMESLLLLRRKRQPPRSRQPSRRHPSPQVRTATPPAHISAWWTESPLLCVHAQQRMRHASFTHTLSTHQQAGEVPQGKLLPRRSRQAQQLPKANNRRLPKQVGAAGMCACANELNTPPPVLRMHPPACSPFLHATTKRPALCCFVPA